MRQITRKTCQAFINRKPFAMGNTTSTGRELILHGYVIAKISHGAAGRTIVTTAGHNTRTTLDRLNGLCELEYGVRPFYIKNGDLYDQKGEWDGRWKELEDCF